MMKNYVCHPPQKCLETFLSVFALEILVKGRWKKVTLFQRRWKLFETIRKMLSIPILSRIFLKLQIHGLLIKCENILFLQVYNWDFCCYVASVARFAPNSTHRTHWRLHWMESRFSLSIFLSSKWFSVNFPLCEHWPNHKTIDAWVLFLKQSGQNHFTSHNECDFRWAVLISCFHKAGNR